VTVSLTVAAGVKLSDGFSGEPDQPEIGYSTLPVTDAVGLLNRKLESGEVRLERSHAGGYLRAVLDALKVPVESQLVVFSRTSLQQRIIYPTNPRTIFFNDSVAVGWVHGEPFVEVAAQDARQGIHFYTLNQTPDEHPKFSRHDGRPCLECHESMAAAGIPGMLVRSSPVGEDGFPMRERGNYVTDHRSPFVERWGGWFGTGEVSMSHLGNRIAPDAEAPAAFGTLASQFDTGAYLSPYSDVAALMVFNHQMRMMNLITRLGWEFRVAKAGDLDEAVREFVDYLLFVDEAPLPGKVRGTSGFAEKFSAQGPRDSAGRSLRDLDLTHRLMKYPCSYMIYSEAFDGMPEAAKNAVYRRMWQVLSGKEGDARYSRLTSADRVAVIEIIRETKNGLPEDWRKRKSAAAI
jgi:hypothetical protein